MAGSIREMSSEMGDNHGNFDFFRLDSIVRRKTRKRLTYTSTTPWLRSPASIVARRVITLIMLLGT